MAFPFLNQVYAGLNADTKPDPFAAAKAFGGAASSLNDTFMGQVYAAAAAARGKPSTAVVAPPTAPPPSPPVVAASAQPAPAQQQPAPQQGPAPQVQDTTVGLSTAPIQYGVINTPGRAAGELNTMGPKQEGFLTKAAGTEGNAQTAAAERVATAMVAQQAPLDERAQYLAALAEREAQDQTGRNEQNRQRQEDYETEAKKLQGMSVDPNRRMKSGEGILDALGIIFGGIGQGYLRRAGDMNAQNVGVQLASVNKQNAIDAQRANIANQKSYVDMVAGNLRAQREQQGDQVASTQRQAQLMKEATGAHFDQAGVGVAMAEALARGDVAQAQAMAKLYQQQAAAQRYVPASGGGQQYVVRLGNGATIRMSEKEFNAYAKDNEKGTIETGQKIAVNAAEARAKADGKDDEARMVDIGDGKYSKARSVSEAEKLDEKKRELEEQQAAVKAVREARYGARDEKGNIIPGKEGVSGFQAFLHKVSAGTYSPAEIKRLKTAQNQLVLAEAKKGGGVVTENDKKNAADTVGNQLSINPFANNQASLDAVQADLDRRKAIFDRGRNVTTRAPKPVKAGW